MIVALYGSPRRQGNTARLLQAAVEGARKAGAEVREIILRDLRINPCYEIYACRRTGACVQQDDFRELAELLLGAKATMLASPIFFYAVSAQVKLMMDRCQSLWVKKYWLDKKPLGWLDNPKPGLFLSAGASRGKELFSVAERSFRYFFDTFDTRLWKTLAYRGLDEADEILKHPEYLEEARTAGSDLGLMIKTGE